MNLKRNIPSFADIDINLYSATLETLLCVVNADIYTDIIPDNKEVQKRIKERIFSTTKLDRMQGTLNFLKTQYIKKYNIWEKCFLPLITDKEHWNLSQTTFVNNRNHVAHNKLLDYMAKEKMLKDTQEFNRLVEEAVGKFEFENISEEVEETLQAIEEQREYKHESMMEIIESEAGVVKK